MHSILPVVLFVFLSSITKAFSAVDQPAELSKEALEEWFLEVNSQYQTLNQYSAHFLWELSINQTDELSQKASEFGRVRTKWRNNRCSKALNIYNHLNPIQQRMVNLLCRGPKYTEFQQSELSNVLSRIQDIYTETQVCLPETFDICLNYKRIWDYTYIRTSRDEIIPLDMTSVSPGKIDDNPLHLFDGKTSPEYYVLRGIQSDSEHLDQNEIDELIRKGRMLCLNIEPELEKIMSGNFSYLNRPDCVLPADDVFQWAWQAWRLAVGPDIGQLYPTAVYYMNLGARNNGYKDIGVCWREELEMHNLRTTVEDLWQDIKPLYRLLHAVLRHALKNKYDGDSRITKNGPLPAHLLGNMWSQDWSAYTKLLIPFSEVDIDANFRNTKWTITDIIKTAEDFYYSMGINPMTKKFWKYSNFNKTSKNTKCHGSAANMFQEDDYRMIVCAEKTLDDFYVITHEMGHIEYYMHMENLPGIFQDATNSAFGEAIGDTMFLASMVPQHLNRLSLLPDEYLVPNKLSPADFSALRAIYESKIDKSFLDAPTIDEIIASKTNSVNESDTFKYLTGNEKQIFNTNIPKITVLGKSFPNFRELNERMRNYQTFKEKYNSSPNYFDLYLLMRMALSKIPQIPFSYILDVFRWDVFSGEINFENANDYYWKLSLMEQGIHPPNWNSRHEFFDAGSKFHVADNTPYIRYFLASILQAQIFKGLCEKTVYGRFNNNEKLPMPLHRCDIYGSKRAGKILKKAINLGSSAHWTEVLYILTGNREITVQPLLEYYQPLKDWLEKLVVEYDIPVGW